MHLMSHSDVSDNQGKRGESLDHRMRGDWNRHYSIEQWLEHLKWFTVIENLRGLRWFTVIENLGGMRWFTVIET